MLILILLLRTSYQPQGEVVELVYGTSLENWRALIAYRGFESHPLRQIKNKKLELSKKKTQVFFAVKNAHPQAIRAKNKQM